MHRPRSTILPASLVGLALFAAIGCTAGGQRSEEAIGQISSALSGSDVLGFESPSSWTVSSGKVTSTTTRTQGAAALAVAAPQNYTTLVSISLASSLPGLAGLTAAGSSVSVDMLQPTTQPNPFYLGALQLYINAPAEGVNNQYLGQTELTGEPTGVFQTYSFPISSFVRTQLAGKSVSDLTFTLALNAPAGATGTYIFDNIRTRSPATAPLGSGSSVDLLATLTTNPMVNTPGSSTFAAGTIQIPQSFHVFAGDPGTGTVTLGVGLGSATVKCTYSASSDKTSYVFKSCNTGNVAGDLVAASFAQLTIVSADPSAPLTKVKAQLAYNLLGDQVGTKLVPPLPTFWGNTLAEISSISVAFGQALANNPPPEQRDLTLPVPAFAFRQGDGTPVDTSNGQPPPPHDPTFNKSGHLNNGGTFDAYYQVQGNLTAGGANNDFTTATNATASAHAVVFGTDVTVADTTLTSNMDTGTITVAGFGTSGTSSASVVSHIFGTQVENNTLPTGGSFDVFPKFHLEKDIPIATYTYWVFSISVDVDGILDVTTTGNVAPTAESVVVTPSAIIAMSVIGSADIGVASGSVDATVQLINVGFPLTFGATWKLDQVPGVCNATLTGDVNGKVTISSLGGNVVLHGTIGDCPFCLTGSETLVSWNPLLSTTKSLFDDPLSNESFPLDPSLCPLTSLQVAITTPQPGTVIIPGMPLPVTATATRPGGTNQPPTDECQFLTWTSSDPGATFSPPTGCTSTVTFSNSAGASPTITGTATDPSGETGTASVTLSNPPQPPTGPVVQILSLTPSLVFFDNTESLTVQITEVVPASDTDTINITVSCTDTFPNDPTGNNNPPGTTTEPFGPTFQFNTFGGDRTKTFTLQGIPGVAVPLPLTDTTPQIGVGPNTITCVATDQNGNTGSNQIMFTVNQSIIVT
jgi:hypothetical protein